MSIAKNTKAWTKPELTKLGKLNDVAGNTGGMTQYGSGCQSGQGASPCWS